VVDSKRFSVFRSDHRVQTSGHLWYRPYWDCTVLYCTVLYCTDSRAVSQYIPCLVWNPKFHDLFTGP